MRTLALGLLVLSACTLEGFPPENQPTGKALDPSALVEAPRALAGTLVANSTSGMVVATDDGHLPLQIGPDTRIAIGEVEVGPRAVQPGAEVRVSYVPGAASGENLAVEIVAVPGTGGWEGEYRRVLPEHRALGN